MQNARRQNLDFTAFVSSWFIFKIQKLCRSYTTLKVQFNKCSKRVTGVYISWYNSISVSWDPLPSYSIALLVSTMTNPFGTSPSPIQSMLCVYDPKVRLQPRAASWLGLYYPLVLPFLPFAKSLNWWHWLFATPCTSAFIKMVQWQEV